ncbi:hypothetical protein H8A99_18480 [Bradyrhizobium sp. Arg68]|uniref:hypothetical protein n=1 Tax=Bradyrhizobium ivorense TaxID=2511166 RepID=UPI001E375E80|nr:hypothetical protein [Bradyrhizobium ivorense]MCC8938406.1 hypothetical protein [Bradyrhizobium ivorense]
MANKIAAGVFIGLWYFAEAINAAMRFLYDYGPAIMVVCLLIGAGAGVYLAATSKSQKKFF